jgi:UDP-3-O-[3-hydroxymyristoyl] N-acetylglucosamine deacetylase
LKPRKRTTLAGDLVFEGRGIHTGERSAVKISPNDEGRGITFSFGAKSYGISDASQDGSMRSTSLVFTGGETVRTAEHLLAAIVGTGLDDVTISPEGDELPIMDGSPFPFAKAILSCGFREFESLHMAPQIISPICVGADSAFIAAMPSNEIKITYVVDYPGSALGTEMKDMVLTPLSFVEEIAPARTFCFAGEVGALKKSGFGLGGDENNVLLIGDEGPVGGYRVTRECAAHKIADLLGDLAATGFIACAHYVCVCGGHMLHARLVDRIRRSVSVNLRR